AGGADALLGQIDRRDVVGLLGGRLGIGDVETVVRAEIDLRPLAEVQRRMIVEPKQRLGRLLLLDLYFFLFLPGGFLLLRLRLRRGGGGAGRRRRLRTP